MVFKMEECLTIEELKKDYEELSKSYNLPDFDKLAEDFDVEKVVEKQTSFLLREIRRNIAEKLSAYLHFFEIIINPASPPLFIFSMLKNLEENDKKELKKIYKMISGFQIEVMKLDTIYEEKKEADFIKKVFSEWQKIKKDVVKILDKLEKGFEVNSDSVKRGYFG